MAEKLCTCQQTPADPERRWVGDACLCEGKERTADCGCKLKRARRRDSFSLIPNWSAMHLCDEAIRLARESGDGWAGRYAAHLRVAVADVTRVDALEAGCG